MTDPVRALLWFIEADFWAVDELSSWADHVVEATADCPGWVLDLSTARSRDEAARVLHGALRDGCERTGSPTATPEDPDRRSEILVGLYVLRAARGRISRQQANREILGVLDAYQPGFLSIDDPRLVDAHGAILTVDALRPALQELASAARLLERQLESFVVRDPPAGMSSETTSG